MEHRKDNWPSARDSRRACDLLFHAIHRQVWQFDAQTPPSVHLFPQAVCTHQPWWTRCSRAAALSRLLLFCFTHGNVYKQRHAHNSGPHLMMSWLRSCSTSMTSAASAPGTRSSASRAEGRYGMRRACNVQTRESMSGLGHLIHLRQVPEAVPQG